MHVGVSFMKFYNKLKILLRFSLVFSVLLDMFIGFEAIIRNNVYLMFLSSVSIFLFIIPLYYSALILERRKNKITENLDRLFVSIEDILKKCDDDYESDFEKEIKNDEDMILFSEYINKNKKVFSDFKNKNNLLNEILISTVINQDIEKFFTDIMPKIMNITKSQLIVFYMVNKVTNKLEIKSSVGFGKSVYSQFDMNLGEGLVGQAAVNNEVMIVDDMEDSVYVVKTFLGDIKTKNVAAVPVCSIDDENDVLGVFAVGSVYKYTQGHIDILKEIRKYIAYAIINGMIYSKNTRLTNELKFQNQLIQNLNEDLEMKVKERTGVLNNIFNSMENYALISIDSNENIITLNNIAAKKFNVIKEDVIGKNILEIPKIAKHIKSKSENYIDAAVKCGKSKYIHKLEDDNEKEMILETEIFSVKDEYGEISSFTIVIKDISYIKKLRGAEVINEKVLNIMLEESSNSIIIVGNDFLIEGISKNAEYLIGANKEDVCGMHIWDIFSESKKIKDFINYVFSENDDKKIKTFNAAAAHTKINISMRVKLINDSSTKDKKVIMYL